MTKKVIVLVLGLVLAIAVLAAANSPSGRIAYHKWRLAAAIENARTAGAGKPTASEEFLALLRGRPASSEECLTVWQRHEDALVKLKCLARREFALNKRANTEERMRIAEAAERLLGRQRPSSVARSPSNEYAVVVTAPARDMTEWERLMSRLEEEAQFARKSGYAPQRQRL